jgi:Arc/MetJ family transcription regulator
LARQHAPEAIRTLAEIACKGKSESVRVSAACALLDRAYGRPAQSVELDLKLTKNLEQMTLQELQELRERYAAVALASPALVIDHDSIEREAVEPEDVADDEREADQGDA